MVEKVIFAIIIYKIHLRELDASSSFCFVFVNFRRPPFIWISFNQKISMFFLLIRFYFKRSWVV